MGYLNLFFYFFRNSSISDQKNPVIYRYFSAAEKASVATETRTVPAVSNAASCRRTCSPVLWKNSPRSMSSQPRSCHSTLSAGFAISSLASAHTTINRPYSTAFHTRSSAIARCVVSVESLPVATRNFAEIFGNRKLDSLSYRVVLFV